MKSSTLARGFVTTLIATTFLWALLLSASPQLHQRVHPDADRVDHNCAVTMVAAGNYDHAAQPPLISAPDLIDQFSRVLALTSTWVKPLFLNAHIFEHAPPARA